MANVDNPFGFRLVSGPREIVELNIDASNASRLGKNDALKQDADGGYSRLAAGELCAYIIDGGFKDSNGQSINYLPASTAGTCNGIKVVPGQIWACQADSGTALTSEAINATADIVAGDCSTTTGISVYELDSSNVGTGQQVRILGLLKDPNNSFAEHADLLVEWSENASTSNVSV